ncbi:hypothetical protein [Mesorhizobium sp. M1142]|uniref:hypothetical protein n=1 Tax=Mesorhizobium sp. M1142 TaxID=2957060 RepID=UPI00333ADF10
MRRAKISGETICACRSISSKGPIGRVASGMGRSKNANSNCMIALLFGGGLGEPAQQSVRSARF